MVGLKFIAVIRPKDNTDEPKDNFLQVISVKSGELGPPQWIMAIAAIPLFLLNLRTQPYSLSDFGWFILP